MASPLGRSPRTNDSNAEDSNSATNSHVGPVPSSDSDNVLNMIPLNSVTQSCTSHSSSVISMNITGQPDKIIRAKRGRSVTIKRKKKVTETSGHRTPDKEARTPDKGEDATKTSNDNIGDMSGHRTPDKRVRTPDKGAENYHDNTDDMTGHRTRGSGHRTRGSGHRTKVYRTITHSVPSPDTGHRTRGSGHQTKVTETVQKGSVRLTDHCPDPTAATPDTGRQS